MATPAELVAQTFDRAASYASNAQSQLTGFLNTLNASVYSPPTISISWATIAPPSLPSLPAQPTMPTIAFVAPDAPDALVIDAPDLEVDEFTEIAPATTFPDAPELDYGTLPTTPTVDDVEMPTAPTLSLPSTPTYLSLSTPTFSGLDLHDDLLDSLKTIPTLTLVDPTPFSYGRGSEYASTLLTSLKATLNARIGGGTGLNAAVEQAIWDRGRSRETQIWLKNTDEITRAAEALGYPLPAGTTAARLEAAQQEYYRKLSDQSRDISIKQADLEQENLKQTIEAGMALEGKLVDYSLQLERLTFDAAKVLADSAIAVYNSKVEQYKALLDGYRTYATAYDTIIKGELAKVEGFRAQVAAEQAKADVNRTLVEQYKASIQASLSYVELYRAQIEAAKTLTEVEQLNVSIYAEQIRGYVARVNAETAKVEAYKAGVEAETTKITTFKVKADAFSARVGAQAAVANANTARFEALVRANTAEFDGYRARVDAERARIEALGAQSRSLLEGYKAGAVAVEASANMHTRVWEGQIKNYEASQQIAIQTAKINGDNAMHVSATKLDAAKVGAQVYAQLTASAYQMMHAQAQISGSGNNAVSYQYTGRVASAAPLVTAV